MRAALRSVLFLLPGLAWWHCYAQPGPEINAPSVLSAETVIRLRTTQPIDSKHVKTGDAIPLEVMRNVRVGNLLVISKYTRVTAKLDRVRRAGRAFRRGSLSLTVDTVPDINGNAIAVRGTRREVPGPERQIDAYTYQVLSLGMLSPLLVFRGDEAVLAKGTEIDAAVSKDVTLDVDTLRQRINALDAEARDRVHTEKATLHVYLYPELKHTGENCVVSVDGTKAVRLRNAHFFDIQVAPGHHIVGCNGHTVLLDAKADEHYYIRVAQSSHWLPTLIDPETGEEQVYPLLAADAKDVYSSSAH